MSCLPKPISQDKRELSPRQMRECRAIVEAVSSATGVAAFALFAPSRSAMATAHARQTAMYLCHVLTGLTMTQVGQFFGRDRTTVAHACALVEDSRDDAVVNSRLDAIESRITQLRTMPADERHVGTREDEFRDRL